MWAERAFALDGSSEAAFDLLEKTARDAGRPERGAAGPAPPGRGRSPVFLGACAAAGTSLENPQLVVVAKLSPGGSSPRSSRRRRPTPRLGALVRGPGIRSRISRGTVFGDALRPAAGSLLHVR